MPRCQVLGKAVGPQEVRTPVTPWRRVHQTRTSEAADMDLPARRSDEDLRKLALAPDDGPRSYLHHSDGSWSFVGDDGWPVKPEDFDPELHADAVTALAAVSYAPGGRSPLIAVRRGLLQATEVDPISVTDTELWRELER